MPGPLTYDLRVQSTPHGMIRTHVGGEEDVNYLPVNAPSSVAPKVSNKTGVLIFQDTQVQIFARPVSEVNTVAIDFHIVLLGPATPPAGAESV